MRIPMIIPMGVFTIIEDPTLIDHVIDWSLCRSPSRAKRRRRLGYKQRTRIVEDNPRAYTLGHRIICHPSIAQMIRDRVKNTPYDRERV